MAQDFFGHEVGISQVVKHLRLNEHADLAKAVTAQHKCKNLAAHPGSDLDVRVRLAFEKTFFKEDPLMDNDTTLSKRLATTMLLPSGPKLLLLWQAAHGNPWCCGCTLRTQVATVQRAPGRKQETSQLKKTSKGISVNVVYQGYTTKGRHCEVQRALVGFLEDHEMNKFTVRISFVPYQDNQRRPLPS